MFPVHFFDIAKFSHFQAVKFLVLFLCLIERRKRTLGNVVLDNEDAIAISS